MAVDADPMTLLVWEQKMWGFAPMCLSVVALFHPLFEHRYIEDIIAADWVNCGGPLVAVVSTGSHRQRTSSQRSESRLRSCTAGTYPVSSVREKMLLLATWTDELIECHWMLWCLDWRRKGVWKKVVKKKGCEALKKKVGVKCVDQLFSPA
jgi:hypothetical protein